jgi:selenocysteine lyase/cysteine desulfurase
MVMGRLQDKGFVSATPLDPTRRAAQVAIRAKDAEAAIRELARRGIIATSCDNNIRTAWHFYNTPDDVEALVQALDEIRELMVC